MKSFPFVVRFPMHWSDMDALGHANNARFFSWFESARVAFFRELDLGHLQPPGCGPILAATSCSYARPLVYPADLAVGVRIARIGRTSVHFEHAVALARSPDDDAATGTAVVVVVDYAKGTAIPVPDEMRARLLAFASPSASP